MRFLMFIILLCVATPAFTASPTSFVSGPNVTAGETSVEGRIGYSLDDEGASVDERLQIRQHVDHGFNDLYALRIITAQDDRKGDDLTHDSVTIENRFQVFNQDKNGFDGGIRLVYSMRPDHRGADNIAANIIGEKTFENSLQARHNVIIKHDIGAGSDDGISLEVRHQLTKKIALSDDYTPRIGIEMFNDFGNLRDQSGFSDQDHQIGPVMKGNISENISYETGYRLGFSRAARDHSFKIGIAASF